MRSKKAIWLIAIPPVLAGAAFFRDDDRPKLDNYVLTKDKAYVLMAPESTGVAHVTQGEWSPDGRRVLLFSVNDKSSAETLVKVITSDELDVSSPRPIEAQISLYDSRSNRATTILTRRGISATHIQTAWMGPTEALVALEFQTLVPGVSDPDEAVQLEFQVVHVSTNPPSAKTILTTKDTPPFVFGSPTRPIGFVGTQSEEDEVPGEQALKYTYTTVLSGGRLGPSVQLRGTRGWLGDISWDPGGATFVAKTLELERTPKKRIVARFERYDPMSWQATPVENYAAPEPPGISTLSLEQTQDKVEKDIAVEKVEPLWLVPVQGEGRGLVAADSDFGKLSPTLDNVLIVSKGVATMRRIAAIPREVFEKVILARKRSETLSRSRMVGAAFMMYASDFDDWLPPPGNIETTIGPYVKNVALLEGFVYTFQGGPIEGMADPAKTQLGFIRGLGGAAVVYLDGHAEWVPDKPKG